MAHAPVFETDFYGNRTAMKQGRCLYRKSTSPLKLAIGCYPRDGSGRFKDDTEALQYVESNATGKGMEFYHQALERHRRAHELV